MTKLGNTDLDVHPLCLGGNVFGWTADEVQSAAVLDAYAAAGGNFVDTADAYGNGASETILGNWITARGNRDDIVVATKVAAMEGFRGLKADNIKVAAENSLRRLQTDRIDLYYAHRDDLDTPLEETLGAFDELVRAGKVRYIAASNYTSPRLAEALAISERGGLASYSVLQQHYNLLERDYEGELSEVVEKAGLVSAPYFALAKGFLTGKYRQGGPTVDSPRAARAGEYLDERGIAVLGVLDELAKLHATTQSAVALAWLLAQPTVAAPIASARSVRQLAGLLPFVDLKLSEEELASLTAASDR